MKDDFNFGDILINNWAGENNPHKKGIFVRRSDKFIEMTDGDGEFWKTFILDNRLEKVGSLWDLPK